MESDTSRENAPDDLPVISISQDELHKKLQDTIPLDLPSNRSQNHEEIMFLSASDNLGNHRKTFSCEFCDLVYNSEKELECHLGSYHRIEKRNSCCSSCGRKFLWPQKQELAHGGDRTNPVEKDITSSRLDSTDCETKGMMSSDVRNAVDFSHSICRAANSGNVQMTDSNARTRDDVCTTKDDAESLDDEDNSNGNTSDPYDSKVTYSNDSPPDDMTASPCISPDFDVGVVEPKIEPDGQRASVATSSDAENCDRTTTTSTSEEMNCERSRMSNDLQAYDNEVTLHQCPVCDKQFDTKAKWRNHMSYHRPRTRRFECDVCGKVFALNQSLKRHYYEHTQNYPFNCEVCKRGFHAKHLLVDHMLALHAEDKPFVCDLCGKSFAVERDLARHAKIHDDAKPHVCTICTKRFHDLDELKQHEQSHNDRTFVCEICDKVYYSRTGLISHVKKNHEGKKLSCKSCKLTFVVPSFLRRHELTHARTLQSTSSPSHMEGLVPLSWTNVGPAGYIAGADDQISSTSSGSALDERTRDGTMKFDAENLTYGTHAIPLNRHEAPAIGSLSVTNAASPADVSSIPYYDSHEDYKTWDTVALTNCVKAMTSTYGADHDVQSTVPYTGIKSEESGETPKNVSVSTFSVMRTPGGVSSVTYKEAYSDGIDETPYGESSGDDSIASGNANAHDNGSVISRSERNSEGWTATTRDDCDKTSGIARNQERRSATVTSLMETFKDEELASTDAESCSSTYTTWNNKALQGPIAGDGGRSQPNITENVAANEGSSSSQNQDFPVPMLHKCPICDKTFDTRTKMMNHARYHRPKTKEFKCDLCSKVFVHNQSLKRHRYLHTRNYPWQCDWCEKGYAEKYLLDQHVQSAHGEDRPFVCQECGKSFKIERHLLFHIKSHAGIQYVCKFCGKGYTHLYQFKEHEKTHGEKMLMCNICGKTFHRKSVLKVHKQTAHSTEKKYVCDICGKGFAIMTWLNLHVAGHNNNRKHVCPQCGMAFNTSNGLSNHKKVHSDEEPFECEQCGKKFKSNYRLSKHQKTHAGLKPHLCTVCGKSFTEKVSLVRHQRTHTGERPYKCKYCGKGYIESYPLTLHLKTHEEDAK